MQKIIMALRDLWTKLDVASRQSFLRTAMWITIIAGTVYTLGQSEDLFINAPLTIKIEAPEKIIFPKSNNAATLPVVLRLKNNMSDAAVLQVPNPCKIIQWYVATHEGEFIQAAKDEVCSEVVMQASLAAGETAQDEIEIPLDTERYQAGTKYQLMMRFWGQEGSHPFQVEFE